MSKLHRLPPQQLSFGKKSKAWRKKHLDWADTKTFFSYSAVRKSVLHMKTNYDLINGKLNMEDLELVLNPEKIQAGYIPDRIQHYPIINAKLNVLRGEESKRIFDYKVIVTDPNSVSEIETNKKDMLFGKLQELAQAQGLPEKELNAELEKINEYANYEWQDLREKRANALLNHYVKEYNIPLIFNKGFMDAFAAGEEIYQCDIVGGEPTIEKLNPIKVRIFRSGNSDKIEDADIIVLEDYWSPSKIIDTYYDKLTKADVKYLEDISLYETAATEGTDNYEETRNFIPIAEDIDPFSLFTGTSNLSSNYYDADGNVRMLKMFWKSKRKIKKVKSYDPETGEEVFNFYPETYILDVDTGEEEEIFWINEAWEATLAGKQVYLNMRPRPVQYNRISNPSRCHFGIIGSIYNLGDNKPFTLIDMMKPYNYLYDAVHDRLNKDIAANWGKIVELDLSQVPKGWDVEKWMYFAKVNKIAVKDSFKEGNIGAATGKLAGAFANNSRGTIDAETGSNIQSQIQLLEFIKAEMSEVAGISRQREGQISNRETVGGVERATLQSSHITEWLYLIHDDVKRRVLECFLETAKIALKGKSKKFQYLLSDMTQKVMEVEGDEFAESDYGLVVSNDNGTQDLNNKLDMLAQAALQNQTLSFSAIMKLYGSTSIAEKHRLVEKDERAMQERQSQQAQQQLQSQEQVAAQQTQVEQAKMELQDRLNQRDNDIKLLMKQMDLFNNPESTEGEDEGLSEKERLDHDEKVRQFNERMKLDKDKFTLDKQKQKEDTAIKRQSVNKTNLNNKQ